MPSSRASSPGVAAERITEAGLEELAAAEQRFSRMTRALRAREPGEDRRSLTVEWMQANHGFHDVIYSHRRPALHRAGREERPPYLRRARGLGAGRRVDRRALPRERAPARGDPRRARGREPGGRSRARAGARARVVPAARDDPRAGRPCVGGPASRPRQPGLLSCETALRAGARLLPFSKRLLGSEP